MVLRKKFTNPKRQKVDVATNDSKDRKLKNEMQSTYMKNYRAAKKS